MKIADGTEVAERPAQQRGAGRTPTSKWRGVTPVQVRGATEAGLRTAPQIQGLLGGRQTEKGLYRTAALLMNTAIHRRTGGAACFGRA